MNLPISHFFIVIQLIFSVPLKAQTAQSTFKIKSLIDKLSQKQIEKTLRDFVKATYPNRMVGSSGHTNAQKFIIESIKAADQNPLKVISFSPDIDYAKDLYSQDFKQKVASHYSPNHNVYQKYKKYTDDVISFIENYKHLKGKNILWEKRGLKSPDQIVLICAHYDTVSVNPKTLTIHKGGEMPGADDNASGVALALELLKILSKQKLAKTIQILFSDFQEFGHLGANEYTKSLLKSPNQKPLFVIILEMLGNDTKTQDREKKYRNFKLYISRPSSPLYKREARWATQFNQWGKKYFASMQFKIEANGMALGDNAPFQHINIPTLGFSQNWETDFNSRGRHTANDFPERINFKTLHAVLKFLTGALLSWDLTP